MAHSEWDKALREMHNQELALFARRAHRRLGRGFVLTGPDDPQPVYVTWIAGAPPPLIDAVFDYDPEHQAVGMATCTCPVFSAKIPCSRDWCECVNRVPS
jgi:hypothetical protein